MVNGDDSCFDVCMYVQYGCYGNMFKQGSSYCSHRYRVHVVNRMGLPVIGTAVELPDPEAFQ